MSVSSKCDAILAFQDNYVGIQCQAANSPAICQLGNLMNTKMQLFAAKLNPFGKKLTIANMEYKIAHIENQIQTENPELTDIDVTWQDVTYCVDGDEYVNPLNLGYSPTSLIESPLKGKVVKAPNYMPPYITYFVDQDLFFMIILITIIWVVIESLLHIRTHSTKSR